MKQEKRISYRAGITHKPSDFLCQDGELAECINLTTDSEELKPMVQPASYMNGAPTIIFIHKFNGESRYISRTGNTINWGSKNGSGYSGGTFMLTASGDAKITAVGKCLTIADNNGLHYFLWKTGAYTSYESIPVPDVEFFLLGSDTDAVHFDQETDVDPQTEQEVFNDLVVGIYTKNKKAIDQKKAFCQPFFVRTALKLYDGTYTHVSQPILMFPSISENTHVSRFWWEAIDDNNPRIKNVSGDTYYSKLYFKNNSNINSDICKSIAVFVSAGIDIYDLAVDQKLRQTTVIHDGVYRDTLNGNSIIHSASITPTSDNNFITKREVTDIENDIKSTSIFYKLCELDLVGDQQAHDIGEKIEMHTLENLTSLSRLGADDYYSFCPLKASMIYSYNSRLNLANVERGFFEGFSNFVNWDNASGSVYDIYVNIKTDNGDVVVKHTTVSIKTKQGVWFYYPDARATNVRIVSGGSTILNTRLTEHPGLNGAYYFAGLPDTNLAPDTSGTFSGSETQGAKELLPNYIIQSEVNNPFVFKSAGYFKVDTGEIFAMSTITQALSQGQFGTYPLLVFSENGIWALSVAKTGYYDAINPMSREVCINPNMVVQTDGAVFFVSKKGLMVIVGNDVKCVSEAMDGKTFNTNGFLTITSGSPADPWSDIITACQGTASFLDYIRDEDCMMAYDYIDSRLLIINPDYNFAYVYNMADGTISKTVLPAAMTNVVNNYPDYLLQSGAQIYTLYGKQREEEINTRQRAFLLTRPMKLAGPLTVSSLRELVNVGMWDEGTEQTPLSVVKTVVWLSDDMRTWHEMQSRFGAAARYFRIGLFINMLPTERLSGTIITEQERRTDNLRA